MKWKPKDQTLKTSKYRKRSGLFILALTCALALMLAALPQSAVGGTCAMDTAWDGKTSGVAIVAATTGSVDNYTIAKMWNSPAAADKALAAADRCGTATSDLAATGTLKKKSSDYVKLKDAATHTIAAASTQTTGTGKMAIEANC